MYRKFTCRLLFLSVLLSVSMPTPNAWAADNYPQRKPGLWQLEMKSDGALGTQIIKQCIDQQTDQQTMLQGQALGQKNCTKNEMRKEGDTYLHESDCRFGKTRMRSTMKFSGNFQSDYTAQMVTHYDPPLAGRDQTEMRITGKYLGACEENQKPGDTIMPDGTKINPLG